MVAFDRERIDAVLLVCAFALGIVFILILKYIHVECHATMTL